MKNTDKQLIFSVGTHYRMRNGTKITITHLSAPCPCSKCSKKKKPKQMFMQGTDGEHNLHTFLASGKTSYTCECVGCDYGNPCTGSDYDIIAYWKKPPAIKILENFLVSTNNSDKIK